MDLKKQIFAKLDASAGPNTILATNTSALSISELAEATTHPERVVGIHFFNPVHKMQLVEVVVGRRTAPEVTQRAVRFVQQLGKLPVIVQDSQDEFDGGHPLPYPIVGIGASAGGVEAYIDLFNSLPYVINDEVADPGRHRRR